MKKIFTENLPHTKETILWSKSIGCIVNFVYDEIKGCVTIEGYDKDNQILIFDYNGLKIRKSTKSFRKCQFGDFLNKRMTSYKYNIGEVINGCEILKKIRINRKSKNLSEKGYVVKCIVDGYSFEVFETAIVRGGGCPVCSNKKTIRGINDIYTTHKWMCNYIVNESDWYKYSYRSSKKVLMRCLDCFTNKNYTISNLYKYKKVNCNCGDGISYPNKFMFYTLKALGVDFETEYSPEWAIDEEGVRRRYDFYVPSKNLIIEMDGGWHYIDNSITGETSDSLKIVDHNKDLMATTNGVKITRINCEVSECEYIKNTLLHSDLIYMFDFTNIKWNDINKQCTKNIVKKVCDEWSNVRSTLILSNMFCLSRVTIIRYLKNGAKIGWCTYNAKEENLRALRTKNVKGKKVEIFDNGVSLGVFNSCAELERNSISLCGEKLLSTGVAACAAGNPRYKTYKGYVFKYV